MSETDYKEIFSKNLKKYMELNNKTQADIINDLGLSSSTVSNWCTGQKLPRMNKIEMLANYFGINKSDLIEDKELEKAEQKIEELSEENKIFFSKYEKLSPEAKKQMLKIIETFEDETRD